MAEIEARFGRYVFLKKLAVGGMAEIYLAQRMSFAGFSRFVVVKRLLAEHRGNEVYERLFLDEARIAAALEHPHIISVFDLGKLDDAFFMVMEYVHGISGAEFLTRSVHRAGSVALPAAMSVIRSIALALDHGHKALSLENRPMGVIHHDISPHNIQIGYDGSVKLLDYGVATQMGRSSARGRRGKFAYMSPEAVTKAPTDHRSDLFSLATVFYEMAVGRRLFKAKSPHETMRRIKKSQVKAPSSIIEDFPVELEGFLARCLAPDPETRFQTGAEFAQALDTIARTLGYDISQDALKAHLESLYADEIEMRWAELVSLSTQALNTQLPDSISMVQVHSEESLPLADESTEGELECDSEELGDLNTQPGENGPLTSSAGKSTSSYQLDRVETGAFADLVGGEPHEDLPNGVNDLDPDWKIESLNRALQRQKSHFRLLLATGILALFALWFGLR